MDTTQKRMRCLECGPVNEETMDDDGVDSSGTDRISNLPRDILCHILSFLPTKYAVGTCILSTRWKNLFPLIPKLKLQLDDSLLLHPESASSTSLVSFIKFVNRLLNVTLHDTSSIHALRLICRKCDDGQDIANWIHAALRLNVKRVTLWNHPLKNSNSLLDSLFGCSIVSLNLYLDFADDAHELRFSLPNLNMLSVQYMKCNVVNAILASCPLLQYLVVHNCVCSFEEKLRICIPSLKALKLVYGVHGLQGEVELDAPKLEYLSYDGFFASRYTIQKLKSLRVARLDLDPSVVQYPFLIDGQAIELVKACSGAERLWFSDTFMRILYSFPHPLPRFPQLGYMMVNYMDLCGWAMLPAFLNSAPNLKILFAERSDDEHYESFKAFLKERLSICFYYRNGIVFEIQRKVEN